MERSEFYDSLRAFVRRSAEERSVDVPVTDIDEDANLFDLGLVNSFSMVALLMHVEELLGGHIDVAEHEPETFFTLRGMYDSLVAQGARR
jgi:acyl carrier protein